MSTYEELRVVLKRFAKVGLIRVMAGGPMRIGQMSGVTKGKYVAEEVP